MCLTCFQMCFFAYNHENKFLKVCFTINVQNPLKNSQSSILHYYCTHLPSPTEEKKGGIPYKNTNFVCKSYPSS